MQRSTTTQNFCAFTQNGTTAVTGMLREQLTRPLVQFCGRLQGSFPVAALHVLSFCVRLARCALVCGIKLRAQLSTPGQDRTGDLQRVRLTS